LKNRKKIFSVSQEQKGETQNREFFVDDEGALYRVVRGHSPQLVIPQSLIQEVISENHDPIFIGHPGSKRTLELISLKYWWPKMRQHRGLCEALP
jgi:hypothetical protein